MIIEEFVIASRFRGPPNSGNGGYTCGRIARHIGRGAVVRLMAPPPLDSPLQVSAADGVVTLLNREQVVAEGRATTLALSVPVTPSISEAELAATRFQGFEQHWFPSCFVCGPERDHQDGLRIFPGAHAGTDVVAAVWTPDDTLSRNGLVADEFLWAALDCPGAFALGDIPAGSAVVLGQLTARIDADVQPGEACVVIAWPMQAEGRKRMAGSAILSPDSAVKAVAQAVWIEVPEAAFAAS